MNDIPKSKSLQEIKTQKRFIKRIKSAPEILFSTEEKISSPLSFTLSIKDSFLQSPIQSPMTACVGSKNTSVCRTCDITFLKNKNKNKYCCFRCYKLSKKDANSNYIVKCMKCKKIFSTKSIFSDFCSKDCFEHFSK